jgi:SAM-dependent methyltransferase
MTPRRRREWFDDDEFWQDVYPFLFPEARFAGAPSEVDKLLAIASPPGSAVLDLGCGPGRMAVPFAARGCKVTAVDRTKYFLDKARARARAAGVVLELAQTDMRDFVRPDAFDLAVSLYTTFGYFDDKAEDRRVLDNLYASLRPGGVCVMEMMGKEVLARVFCPTLSERLANGSVLMRQHEIFDDWTRIRNTWIVIRKGRAKNYTFHHTVYSGEELRQLLDRTGFVDVTLYGTLDAEPYDTAATRLVAVARKPA